MKRLMICFFIVLLLQVQQGYSQSVAGSNRLTYRVAILAPLYLDSVFNTTGTFKYKQGMPRFMMPGLDFVNGARIALDSMVLSDGKVEAVIYDTRSYHHPLNQLIQRHTLDSFQLLIGAVKDNEYKTLAEFALNKQIPFVSAIYPNDGGVTRNPFVILMNSTLRAHCEAIYSFILQNHGTDKIFLCRQNGIQEDRVAGYFKQINEQDGKPLLPIQTIRFDSLPNTELLRKKLDSNRNTILIGGSLDEKFATALAQSSADLVQQRYPIKLMGMPNWDGFKSLTEKEELKNFPVYYTSPYYNAKTDSFSRMLTNHYQQRMNGKPTDMAFRGFETVYLFTQLLTLFPDEFMSHLNDKSVRVFNDYNFKPVSNGTGPSVMPDYFENKHLYFLQILNGTISKAW